MSATARNSPSVLNSGTNELASTKSAIISSDEVWGGKIKILEDRIAEMRQEMDHIEAKAAEKRDKLQAESNQQLQKMGSTLKTLNGMFKSFCFVKDLEKRLTFSLFAFAR